MTDDLDDLRRRNAEMLGALRMVMQHGRIDNSESRMNAVARAIVVGSGDDAAQRPQNDETPRRVAADFWNG